MVRKPLTAEEIIGELALDTYVLNAAELERITCGCRDVLSAQIERTHDLPSQVVKALDFIKIVWRKYDCEQVATIYDNFVKIEEALFGLERQEEIGKRYRDHFVHMFNCFVLGLRIVSSLLKEGTRSTFAAMFKVQDEKLKEVGLPFGSDYKCEQRLFYLWTLVSTFHDIAIPFQHLASLGKGISRFVEEFGWVFTDPQISMHSFDSAQLHYYFSLVASVYSGELEPIGNGRKYKRGDKTNHYLTKLLGREFDRNNHGVLGGFFMWKTIEEIFLVGRSTKYQLGLDQFNTYTEYVLEQDITRAALAISLHGLAEDEKSNVYPKVFPIPFGSYPLAFLLILSDELQEYLRWEGVSLKKQPGGFYYHPLLDMTLDNSDNTVALSVSFSLSSNEKERVIDRANKLARHSGLNSSTDEFDEAVDLIGNSIKKNLELKLDLGRTFKLKLNIHQDWDRICFSKDMNSQR